ncbi:MAG: LamG-like jellyroll fold domain-containing protein [bacterium]
MSTYNIDSKIYKWNGSAFAEFQSIPTHGASGWESFNIGTDTFIAIANGSDGSTHIIDSDIYRWDGNSFIESFSVLTHGACDWEYFTVGNEDFLAVANSYNGSSYNIDSIIYKICADSLNEGLVGYYPFNGNADDESGNENHGTVYGATLVSDRFENPYSAYRFDGKDDFIEVPDSGSLDITGAITLTLWTKADVEQYFRVGLIDKRPATEPSGGYDLVLLDQGDGSFAYFDLVISNTPLPSIVGSVKSDTNLSDNQWHHIASTYDGISMKMYIDGMLENSVSYTDGYVENDALLYIGLFPYGYDDGHGNEPNILNGVIDEVRIYSRALSESEIKELHQMATYKLNLPAGWSMISLPIKPDEARMDKLFPDAAALFKFTTKYEQLDPNDELEVGKGYWIYIPEAKTYSMSGTPFENFTIKDCQSGWSMMGGCSCPVKPSVDNNEIRVIFGFSNKYVRLGTDDPLEPGKGYWINLAEHTTLTIE